MADITLTQTDNADAIAASFRGLAFTSKTDGYWFYRNATSDLVYRKTTDGGATWGDPVTVQDDTTLHRYNIWPDWWTPGDTGNLIHIVWASATQVQHQTLDTSDDSLSISVSVGNSSAPGTQSSSYPRSASPGTGSALEVCKARGGNLGVCWVSNGMGAANSSFFAVSTDGGSTWDNTLANPFESNVADRIILQPGDAADNNDFMAMFWDVDADEWDRKNYDNSGDAWDLTNITTGVGETFTFTHSWAAAPRHSNNKTILVGWNAGNVSTADLLAFEVGSGDITQLTNVITDEAGHIGVGITIDQQNDLFTVFYLGDPAETFATALNIRYKQSSDGGTTWGSAVQYNDDAASEHQECYCDISVGDTKAGRIGAVWIDRAPNPDEFMFNTANAIDVDGGSSPFWSGNQQRELLFL